MSGIVKFSVAALAIVITLQAIYSSGFGLFDPLYQRPLVLCASMLVMLGTRTLLKLYPSTQGALKILAVIADLVMAGIIILATYRYIVLSEELSEGFFILGDFDKYLALAMILAILELNRRVFGLPVFIITGVFLLYGFFGNSFPGFLQTADYSLETIVTNVWLSTTGILGIPMAVMLSMVLIFIAFGIMLEGSGSTDILLRMAMRVTRKLRGGPGHAAVIASALFGTISGSAVANVVSTGSFTIPMSLKRGFSPTFAAAVESAASCMGNLTPPVMGALLFLVAEYTGMPYIMVCLGAVIPVLLFYFAMFLTVELEAFRIGLSAQASDDETVDRLTGNDWLKSTGFFVPILIIVFLMVAGRSPAMAGFWAIICILIFSLIFVTPLAYVKKLPSILIKAGKSCANIVTAVAGIGILIAVLETTGSGLKFAQLIMHLSGESLLLALILTMAGSIVLSMGMPPFPAYLIIIIVMGPEIINLGAEPLSIHLFVVYFAVLSGITPPVAMVAYAASTIAESNPFRTCIRAFRITALSFFVPYLFVFHPSMLLVVPGFSFVDLVWVLIRMVLAQWAFVTGSIGVSVHHLSWKQRPLRVLIAFLVIVNIQPIQIIAVAASIVVIAYDAISYISSRKKKLAEKII